MDEDQPDAGALDEVMRLFSLHQRRIYLMVLPLVGSAADAEEVLQETSIVVWQKFSQFQPGTDFRAWVSQIAYLRARKHIDRKRRQGACFSNELLDQIQVASTAADAGLEARREMLAECFKILAPADRQLLETVYGHGTPVPRLARQSGRKETSIYRSLRRIRTEIFNCVQARLAAERVR